MNIQQKISSSNKSTMKTLLRIAVPMSMALLATTLLAADSNPPDKMSYQGYLVDAVGIPLGSTNTGPKNYDVVFRIYSHETASSASYRLWTEMQTVTVDKGVFSIVLGDGGAYGSEARPPLSTIFTNADASDRYVETMVRGIGAGGADSTVLPRLRLMAAPYAFLAGNATKLAGVDASSYVRKDQTAIFTGGIQSPSVKIDSTAGYAINGVDPVLSFDANDSLQFSRANNQVKFVIGGSTVASVNASGTVTANGGFTGAGTVPVGTIVMWSGTSTPAGWAICDGSQGTPDLRGRFVLASGTGSGLTTRTLGQTGGEQSHVLTAAELPSHSHTGSGSTSSGGGHAHTYYSGHGSQSGIASGSHNAGEIGYTDTYNTTSSGGDHNHSVSLTVSSSGSGSAHNIMPPYYVLAFIQRVQ
jgi:microcystin-dependent protein